jgi:NitT/TauT family transport system ATP-binding protein
MRQPPEVAKETTVTEAAQSNLGEPDSSAGHLTAAGVSIIYDVAGRSRSARQVLAVDSVSLRVRRGEFHCLVGPSGCGKTTFLNAVAGFLPISAGELTLDGLAIAKPGPDRAMVFQQPNLFPWRTVQRNVTYGLEMSGRAKGDRAARRAGELLDLVGLSEFTHAYPGQLSGGMQQRVNLARALAVSPELLLLDEPFASVDAQTREVLQGELLRIVAETGVTALFVTHDITEAVFLGDRVSVFSPRPGRIIHETNVNLPKPRPGKSRREPEFLAYVDEVASALAGGSAATPEE